MKKNYFAQLKEYDARTSNISKRDKYCRKFINTCYDDANKQNFNPNLSLKIKSKNKQNSSHKHKAKVFNKAQSHGPLPLPLQLHQKDKHQSLTTKNQFQYMNKVPLFQPFTSQVYQSHFTSHNSSKGSKQSSSYLKHSFRRQRQETFEEAGEGYNAAQGHMIQMINEMSDMKIKCINIQRKLTQKQSEETQKCQEYYQMLVKQIQIQQKASMQKLHHHFQKCHQIIQSKISQITSNIQKLSLNLYQKQYNTQNLIQRSINKEIGLEMLLIHINKESQTIIKKKIHELGLFNLHELFRNNKEYDEDGKQVCNMRTENSFEDEKYLMCNQQLRSQKNKRCPLNISFQKESNLFQYEKVPLIIQLSQESQGISPSFKIF